MRSGGKRQKKEASAKGGSQRKKRKPAQKKSVDLGGGMYCWELFDVFQSRNILADVDLPISRAPLFFTSVKRER